MDSLRGNGARPPPPPSMDTAESGKVELCADIDTTKADSDKKSYRLIRLQNGLRVLLVHDPPSVGSSSQNKNKSKDGAKDALDYSCSEDDEDEDEDDEDGDSDSSGDDEDGEDRDSGSSGEDGEDGEEESDGEGPEGVKKAAAAMAVGVGNLSDPENCQGLAHYLEHMLFMGSSKYPDENEYDSFMSKSGGGSNAYTECEYTLYHFDVLPQHLEKALDIFAQFFVSPLMKADSSDRELESIESEFCLSKNSDSCRLQELWCHTSKRDHPYSKFCWGNMWSLRHEPRSKGVDVHQELVDFHAKHYRAPLMQLVVLGRQSLDELQGMVVSSFSGVAPGGASAEIGRGGLPEPSAVVAAAGLPFHAADALGRAFRVQPVRDLHRLHVTWQLGEQHSLYKTKPSEYIGHLIGHEGEGSVLSLLRHKRWATGISAGISGTGFNSSSCCATFCVSFYLSKAGVRHWLDVVDILFRYIGMLRREGPQEWVFQEIRDVANIQYRFQQESEPDEWVEMLAEQMLPTARYEDLHILKGPYVMENWDPQMIEGILGQMTPSLARYDVQSSLFGRAVDAPNDADKAETPANGGGDGGKKRGKKKAAAPRKEVEGGDDDEDSSEEGSEEGSEENSEDEDSDDESEGSGDTGEEEEEEEIDEAHYHALCKKPEHEPLQEPRFGLCFWNDAVPSEILEAWEASQQQEQERKKGDGSVARATLISSSLQGGPQAAPSSGTTDKLEGHKHRYKQTHPQKQQGNNGAQGKDAGEAVPTLTLPKPNPFIPSEFAIKEAPAAPPSASRGVDKGEGRQQQLLNKPCPRKVVREGAAGAAAAAGVVMLTLWHLQDRIFMQPRAEIYLKVETPVCNESARSAALCELVVRLVNDSLVEYSYAAYVAELQYDLKATDMGFEIHVSGFDHKAPLMLREVLKRLLDLGPHLKEGPLSVQLEALIRAYHNADMKPGKHVSNVRLQALRKGRWSAEQKQTAMTRAGGSGAQGGPEAASAGGAYAPPVTVSLEDLRAFLRRLFHRVDIEGLVHGNFSDADAESVLDDIEKVTVEAAHSREGGGDGNGDGGVSVDAEEFEYPEEPVVQLNPSQHVLYCCPSKDPTEQNCALEVYWQIGVNSLEERVIADAIEQVLDEPLYDQLRTKEQLGYSVGGSARVTCGVLGFCICVQSAAYGPAHLYARVRSFIKTFRDMLAGMKEDVFSTHMESAVAHKLQPDNTLRDEAQSHWPEIYSRRRAFHVVVAEAMEMRGLEKSTVLQAYDEWFSSKPCLTLAVTGGGKFDAEDEAKAIQSKIQEEIGSSQGDDESLSPRKTCVRIAAPPELYCPSDGRDVFPEKQLRLHGGPSHLIPEH
eukprot:g3739.t1